MIFALLGMLACTSSDSKEGDVLLLMVSGVRADRVGAYGYNPSETPNLDKLATQGTKFLRSYAPSAVAEASAASLVTGWAPPRHGVRTPEQGLQVGTNTGEVGGLLTALAQDGHVWEWARIERNQTGFPGFERLAENHADVDFWLVQMPELGEEHAFTWSDREYDAALNKYDEMIGVVLADWERYRPKGLTIVSGVVGSLQGARDDAVVGLTDDQLRVPLVVKGGEFSSGWEIVEVVSTMDVASTVAQHLDVGFDGQGKDLRYGGSELAYHESTYAYSRCMARPLVGYTTSEGRYSEGVYGQWYPASKDKVHPFPFPRSEYPAEAETLRKLRSSLGGERGLPDTAWALNLDPSGCVAMDTLARKANRAIARGRVDAAKRMVRRLQAQAPNAPITLEIEAKLSGTTAEIP